jgi:hypothetical protein
MIIGGVLIATALITYLAYYKKPVNKYSLKYYRLKWHGTAVL